MQKLVECVPNISEGRDQAIIDSVTSVIEQVNGVHLLDVDPGADTNRTVITFIGSPDAVAEAAFRTIQRAAALIDMAQHSGAHPRHGATDVCPFVPVRGVTMAECVAIARSLGKRLGEELNIPVYLYEAAATTEARRNLAHVRKGEYEALPTKLGTTEWAPDYGPNVWDEHTARTGATNVAARGFLVAYNVNLNTANKSIAQNIALDIKAAGRAKRDPAGKLIKDSNGHNILTPGPYRLAACKAVGWVIPAYERAQVSMNLVDTSVTKPHEAFDACCLSATDRGVRVTGSELVGLIPENDIVAAGKHYLRRAGQSAGVPRKRIIETAIQSMGLRELGAFDAAEKIIEYRAGITDGPLVCLSNREFVDELSSDSPAPGGGSVAALSAAHAAGLVAMVANLTVGKKGYEGVQGRLLEIAEAGQELKDFFLEAVDRDTEAFNRVMETFRLPKDNANHVLKKALATAAATREATRIPLAVLDHIPRTLEIATEVGRIGNTNSLSDAGVAILSARAAAEGAYYNVLINLASLQSMDQSAAPEFLTSTRAAAIETHRQCEQLATQGRTRILTRLESAITSA